MDNTKQFANLRAFVATGSAANATYMEEPLFLRHEMEVIYKLSDRWFIMTVTFGCLDLIAIITVIALLIWHKRLR